MTKLLLSVAILLLSAYSINGVKQCDAQGHSCGDLQTCCRLTSGQWGCCPAPSAVCCNDNTCCPSGTSCAGNGRCARLTGEHFFLDENAAHRVEATFVHVEVVEEPVKTKDNQCGNGEDSCPDSTTCCQLTTGGWGCCPYDEGVCCDGEDACCPGGTTCTGDGRCARGFGLPRIFHESTSIRTKAISSKPKTQDNQCGNGEDSCPDSTTCCQLTTGGWGCCPYDEGVCCDGEDACCPHGTTCTGDGRCARGLRLPKIFEESASIRVKSSSKPKTKDIQCGNGEDSCPDSTTCCELTTGGWGCCPYDSGVCCDGEDACCPGGTTCTGDGRCARGTRFPFIFEDSAAARVKAHKTQKQCGNSEDSCPDSTTCCQLTTGGWGCCPYDGGVCCDGEDACCPGGTTCTGTGRCARGSGLPEIFEITASTRVHATRN